MIWATVSSVQSLSRVQIFANPQTAARQASLSITNSRSSLKLMSIESVMPSNHCILCRPLLLPPWILPSIRVFSNESALHIRWPKYWSFIFNISPSNEYSELISFRMDWLDLLAVQGTLKSLLKCHSSKESILQRWDFFIVPIGFQAHIAWLSRHWSRGWVGTDHAADRCWSLLISWLQSPSAVILEPPKIKFVTVSTVSPSISHEVMGPDAMISVFSFWNSY